MRILRISAGPSHLSFANEMYGGTSFSRQSKTPSSSEYDPVNDSPEAYISMRILLSTEVGTELASDISNLRSDQSISGALEILRIPFFLL